MYMMVKLSDLFGFVNNLENIIYGLGFKLFLKRNNNDRTLFRVNAGVDAVGNEGNIDIIIDIIYIKAECSWFYFH